MIRTFIKGFLLAGALLGWLSIFAICFADLLSLYPEMDRRITGGILFAWFCATAGAMRVADERR